MNAAPLATHASKFSLCQLLLLFVFAEYCCALLTDTISSLHRSGMCTPDTPTYTGAPENATLLLANEQCGKGLALAITCTVGDFMGVQPSCKIAATAFRRVRQHLRRVP